MVWTDLLTLGRTIEKETNAESQKSASRQVERIVVATDLSARSDRALQRALALSAQHGASLLITHIVDEDLTGRLRTDTEADARDYINSALSMSEVPDGLDVTVDVTLGKDHRDILAKADTYQADLIVLGRHRNESGRVPITGTTMERVIRGGGFPTLVAVDPVLEPYKNVMVGVDFSVYSRFAVRNAIALTQNAMITAVHAFHVPFEGFQVGRSHRDEFEVEYGKEVSAFIQEELELLIKTAVGEASVDFSIHQVVRHGQVQKVLRTVAEEVSPDLMVLGTHGRVGLAHTILGSVAESFLSDPSCDILVVKAW